MGAGSYIRYGKFDDLVKSALHDMRQLVSYVGCVGIADPLPKPNISTTVNETRSGGGKVARMACIGKYVRLINQQLFHLLETWILRSLLL
jgi:hypothetical protein